MKKLLTILSLLLCLSGTSQTSLSFTQIPYSDPEVLAPGRGAEHWGTSNWDDTYNPTIPAGNSTPMNYYTRFNWMDIENNGTLGQTGPQGEYHWDAFDAFVHQAIDKGAMFSFGVMPICDGCGGTFGNVPTYLHNLQQAEGGNNADWQYSGFWIPNWNSPSWQARWAAMMSAVADHINTTSYKGVLYKNALYYVDVRGYGNFGEWHTYPWRTSTPARAVASAASLKGIIDAVKTAFPDNMLVIPMGGFDTDHDSQIPAQAVYYNLTVTNNFGLMGWRRDNIGDDGYNSWLTDNPGTYNPGTGVVHFNTLIMDRWKTSTIGGEPAVDLNGTSRCGSIQCDMLNEVNLFHMSSFGNGNYPILNNATLTAAVRGASKASGYRLVLTGGSMTSTLTSNAAFNITLNWQNLGVAPPYLDWAVTYELRNASNTVVWTSTSAFTPKFFLPQATPTAASDNLTLGTVPTGTYSMYMLIKDPVNYRKPLQLNITGRNADGSYLLRSGISVIVGNPFTVNAGSDQSLSVGTTSTTLSGSISDTTVSKTYTTTWTKISGPANGTITSPSARSTTVTGLIAGTYVFRMTVVDNSSTTITDDIQVTIAGNSSPVAHITTGTPSITLPTNSVTLSGTTSTDADGTITGYFWTRVSGPNTPTITTTSASSTSITGLIQGTYVFQLQVTDNLGATGTVTQTILVNPIAGTATNAFTTQTPTTTTENDGQGIEIGVKIQSSIAGFITGVRFYKTTGNSGTHTGQLYSSGGTLLASAVFSGETATGWQTVTFPTAVAIAANTTYIAAYFSPQGQYVSSNSYFTSAVTNSPLTALANGTDGGNGVFKYTASAAFPSSTYQSTNYWVDVVFSSNIAPIAGISGTTPIQLPTSSVNWSSNSTDPDGTVTGYAWASTAGPNTPNFALSGSNVIISNLIAGTYTIKLTVTDNLGATNFTTKSLVVNPATAATSFVIGTGSGSVSLTSMSGHNPGDTCYIKDGLYTSGTFDNLNGIIIRPQTTRTTFNGSVEFRNNKFVDWGYVTWTGFTGYALDMRDFSGNINNTRLHNMSFNNGTGGACINVNSNNSIANYVYGDTSTYAWYKVTLDSISEYNCPYLVQGSFGAPNNNAGSPPNVFCKTTISNFVGTATSATSEEGTEVRGIMWQCNFYNWVVTSTTQRLASGDVGLIYGHVSGNFHDIVKWGGPGYIIRAFPSAELSRPDSINVWNCAKFNSTEYGLALTQEDPSDSVAGKFGNVAAVNIFNNTLVNARTNITYWCQVAVIGLRGSWTKFQIRNNLAINNDISTKTDHLVQNMGETWPTFAADVTNNIYFSSATAAKLDSTTTAVSNSLGNFAKYRPTSNSTGIVAGGVENPFTTTDHDGVTRTSGDIGYLEATVGNVDPVADIKGNTSIILPIDHVDLTGEDSYDPDGTIATYAWTLVSGPDGSSFSSTDESTTTLSDLVAGTYVVQLEVTDNDGGTNTTTRTITLALGIISSDILINKKAGRRIFITP